MTELHPIQFNDPEISAFMDEVLHRCADAFSLPLKFVLMPYDPPSAESLAKRYLTRYVAPFPVTPSPVGIITPEQTEHYERFDRVRKAMAKRRHQLPKRLRNRFA